MPRLSKYELLTVVTAVATLALIGVGALVRTTGSGLGCPDWPLCHGALLPPLQKGPLIEYSHRSLASLVGVLIVATAITTLRIRREDVTVRTLAVVSVPLLALQAWLGKVTVERELPPEVVAVHLATALVLFAVLSLIAVFAFLGPARRTVDSRQRRGLLRVALGATVVMGGIVLVGSYVVGADAGFACTDWPGCPQARIPFFDGDRLQHIHWLHRLTVLAGFAAVALVAFAANSLREPAPMLRRAASVLLGLYVLQIAIGALNIWSDLSEAARVGHLVAGSAIWALLVTITVAGRFEPGPRTVDAAERRESRQMGDARV